MFNSNTTHYNQLEKTLNYKFSTSVLRLQALTRPSYINERSSRQNFKSFQRLEWLGDKVINLIITDIIIENYSGFNIGQLTEIINSLIANNGTLMQVARSLNLQRYIRMGRGEEQSGMRQDNKVIVDALEAIIGAMFLDSQGNYTLIKSKLYSYYSDAGVQLVQGADRKNFSLMIKFDRGKYDSCCELIGYTFNNQSLLTCAFTTNSYINDLPVHQRDEIESNEKLALIGNKLIQLVAAEKLIKDHPDYNEGQLSDEINRFIATFSKQQIAKNLQLNRFILLGKGDEQNRNRENPQILAKIFDAVIGAMFADSNYNYAIIKHVIDGYYQRPIAAESTQDAQSTLRARHTPQFYSDFSEGTEAEDTNRTRDDGRGIVAGAGGTETAGNSSQMSDDAVLLITAVVALAGGYAYSQRQQRHSMCPTCTLL